ncbi:hypothetical protein V6U78_00145 [Marinospirillum sp. MEB164]|uniref:Uncharacterized protein n=1 Tax=Marinospirillum alkalitolerans TaxID=3123374 RepID=A0ABW8PU65_9GAMM
MSASEEEKNRSMALVASVLFIIAFVVVAFMFFQKFMINPQLIQLREGHRDELYCQMVLRYMETDGREGWRDYRGIFYKDCIRQ